MRFPGISAKLVRKFEITENLHRCKRIPTFFCKFFVRGRGWYESNFSCGLDPLLSAPLMPESSEVACRTLSLLPPSANRRAAGFRRERIQSDDLSRFRIGVD